MNHKIILVFGIMKNIKLPFFYLLLSFFLILSPSVLARDYYVAPNGNNNNNGSQSSPWKTIQYAVTNSRISPGDTINVGNGLYEENIRWNSSNAKSGLPGSPITLKAVEKGKAKIKGPGTNSQFEIKDLSHITVNGIRLENYKGNGFSIHQQNVDVKKVVLKNCEIYNQMSRGGKKVIGIMP